MAELELVDLGVSTYRIGDVLTEERSRQKGLINVDETKEV